MQGLSSPIRKRLELGQVCQTVHEENSRSLKTKAQLSRAKNSVISKRLAYELHSDKKKFPRKNSPKPQPEPKNSVKPKPKPPYPQKTNLYTKRFPSKCFRCQQPGYRSNECPQRPIAHLVGECKEETDSKEYINEAFQGGDPTHGDEGELAYNYILQKLLLSPTQPSNSKKNSLFRIRCTMNGKVCEVIINSGSVENSVWHTS